MKNLRYMFGGFILLVIGILSGYSMTVLPTPASKIESLGFALVVFGGIFLGLLGILLIIGSFLEQDK